MSDNDLAGLLMEIRNRLAKSSLRQGENIRLTETQDGASISAEPPPFPPKLMRWLMHAHDWIEGFRISSDHSIHIEQVHSAYKLMAEIPEPTAQAAAVQPQADFPFKTVIKDSASVTVLGYNPDRNRLFRNFVSLGMSRLEIPETTISGISSDTWIYIEVAWKVYLYEASVKTASSLPDQASDKYNIPIAFVKTRNAKVSQIHQFQCSPVDQAGRIF